MHTFFLKDNEIGDDLKLKILQNNKATEPEESLTLKPFDIPAFQEKPLLKPESESEPTLSKHPKNLDELVKNDHDKTKGDLETSINKISTDRNTDHKPISAPTLNQEDAKTKKDNFVIETKPGDTAFLVIWYLFLLPVFNSSFFLSFLGNSQKTTLFLLFKQEESIFFHARSKKKLFLCCMLLIVYRDILMSSLISFFIFSNNLVIFLIVKEPYIFVRLPFLNSCN